jgi:predicted O-methyltransferase YrrM
MHRQFSVNWFDSHMGTFNNFLSKFKNLHNVNFLEVGSYEGKSTCYMLDNFLQGSNSKIYCVDSWEGGFEHASTNFNIIFDRFKNNISNHNDKVEILKGNSYDQLMTLRDKKEHFDFIYIDGGHTVKDVLNDLVLTFPLLKSGGIMAMDDYTWGSASDTGNRQEDHKRPELAINTFLLGVKDEIEVIHASGQVWIRKK